MYKYVLFDLDGTLTNPYIGITSGFLYALEHLNYECPPREDLKCLIGPPLIEIFRRRFGMGEKTAKEGIRLYREYYSTVGLFENELINGSTELLSLLQTSGKHICLATSKPKEYSVRILEHFDLIKYFHFIGAATLDGTIGTKEEVIRSVLCATNADVDSCVLVGDRMHDIIGAHNVGMKCIAVLSGFGDRAEFEEYHADFIVDSLAQVSQLV